jgi:hypothetical protein
MIFTQERVCRIVGGRDVEHLSSSSENSDGIRHWRSSHLVLIVSIDYFTGCSHETGSRRFHQRLE